MRHTWWGEGMKHKAGFPVYLHIQPPVKQIPSFHSKCFEQKTVLLCFYLEGTEWYLSLHQWHQIQILTLSKQLLTKCSSAWPSSILIWFLLSDFPIYFLHFSVLLHFHPCSHPNFCLCFMIPWVALLCTITVYLVLLPKCQSILLIQTLDSLSCWEKTHYCPCSSCLQQIIEVAKSYSCIFIWFWSR